MSPGETSGTNGNSLAIADVEALVSRLCHDLVGPVGAIRNGLEVLEDAWSEADASPKPNDGGGGGSQNNFAADALKLMAHSADQASRRLQFYRLAWGRAGGESAGSFGPARDAASGWLEGGRLRLDWEAATPPDAAAGRRGVVRLLLNLLLLAADLVPTGGTLTVSGDGDETTGWARVAARGRPPWRTEVLGPLCPLVPGLAGRGLPPSDFPSTRLIPALLVQRFATYHGFALEIREDPGREVSFRFPWC